MGAVSELILPGSLVALLVLVLAIASWHAHLEERDHAQCQELCAYRRVDACFNGTKLYAICAEADGVVLKVKP